MTQCELAEQHSEVSLSLFLSLLLSLSLCLSVSVSLSPSQMLSGLDTEDFLSSLLDVEDAASCPSLSPHGSDSGISDHSSSGKTPPGCPSPQGSDPPPSPSCYSQPTSVLSELAGGAGEAQAERAQAVQTEHSYALLQGGVLQGERPDDALLSVRADKPDEDVFIDLGKLEGSVTVVMVMGCGKTYTKKDNCTTIVFWVRLCRLTFAPKCFYCAREISPTPVDRCCITVCVCKSVCVCVRCI